ncbi:hypothetical protein FZC66_09080 [Priestia megaterium]|nr:hypothetical protein FZC66_09080 [Priestia megaterium]
MPIYPKRNKIGCSSFSEYPRSSQPGYQRKKSWGCSCTPCCCPSPRPSALPYPICPCPTLPEEPLQCEQRREAFAARNPHFRFDLNLVYYFLNNQATFAEASEACATLGEGFRLPSPQEVADMSTDFKAAGLCPMLVWTINNGIPALVYVFPGDPNPVRLISTQSLSCRAYHFCVGFIE